jgi:oxygen-independent coproporphyrinogen-3 oxidase
MQFEELDDVLEHLKEMEFDGLITKEINTLHVTEKGKAFVRNICMAFDLKLLEKEPSTQLFSMTI